jgi:NADH dehydrogenase
LSISEKKYRTMKILITGATGFLGIPLCRSAMEHGHHVRAFIRPANAQRPVFATEVVMGDLRDAASLHSALNGMECVIHAGAVTSEQYCPYAVAYETNVVGTKLLIEACLFNHVQRLVLISSQSAREENTGTYGSTKWEAEKLIRASHLHYTVLRPSLIYGPGERGLFKKMVNLIQALPIVPVLGSGHQILRPIYVFDVVAAVMECLRLPQACGKVYDLGGEANITFNEFLKVILQCLGENKRLLHIPVWSIKPIAILLEKVLTNPPITRDNLIGIIQSVPLDNASAKQDLGFEPTPLSEGLKKSLGR